MRLETTGRMDGPFAAPLAVVAVAEGGGEDAAGSLAAWDESAWRVLAAARAAGDFSGKEGETVLAYGGASTGPRRVLCCGIGTRESLSPERMRELGGRAVRAAERRRTASLVVVADHLVAEGEGGARLWQGLAEGLVLASWRFDEPGAPATGAAQGGGRRERSGGGRPFGGQSASAAEPPPSIEKAVLVGADEPVAAEAVRAGRAFAEGENLARTLQARPGNLLTPVRLAEEADRAAEESGLACRILGPRELEAERMGALLAVARGSDEEPRLIVLRHEGGRPGEPPLVLVGKGLTFDAGGISIKPAKGMEEMKYDMSGGAAVLGAMHAVGKLGLPANVVGVVPSSENLLGGSATKPGDVVTTRAGKTVEVVNTDAEGRLILADALDYAAQWKPAAIVDCATLTGACVVALGRHRSGLLGNDDRLLGELAEAGDAAGQPVWRLPLDPPYRKQLDSDFADLKNVGGREGGAVTAACFLAEFGRGAPWAHLDVAGTAYGKTEKPYLRDGPAGNPCRLLLEWVRARTVGGASEDSSGGRSPLGGLG